MTQYKVTSKRRTSDLLYGFHAVAAAWINPLRRCYRLFATSSGLESLRSAMEQAACQNLDRPCALVSPRRDLDRLIPGAVHQGLILDASRLPHYDMRVFQGQADVIVLDQVTDPHNIGAILRSVAAFSGAGVIVTTCHAPGITGTIAKSACGALEHIPLVRVVNLARMLQQLQTIGYQCIGLAEQAAYTLAHLDLCGPTAFVLGAEGKGLRHLTAQRCDLLAKVPTSGYITSLNVSNVAVIALYEKARLG